MLDFSAYIDLPFVWGAIIAISISFYVLLDGFDLGVGILFPFAPSHECRNKMVNSIAPFWDGNETWLVLGGGGILAAFPTAYSILMPALYLPLITMLISLIFRGVAFEFRFKAESTFTKTTWEYAFHFGSMFAAFFQGVMLGTILQGIEVENFAFKGGSYDWLTPFSIVTGIAVMFGYSLLGSNWVIMKTTGTTQAWARRASKYISLYIMMFLVILGLWMPFINDFLKPRWLSYPYNLFMGGITIALILLFYGHQRALIKNAEYSPFIFSTLIFIVIFCGLGISLYPYLVPYKMTLWQVAAYGPSQSLILIGVSILLPLIVVYTSYSYYVFRGKVTDKAFYNH